MTARSSDWIRAMRSACVAEVIWLGADGVPGAVPATPLLLEDRPALAYPYAHAELARRIGTAAQLAVVLSDGRLAGSAWWPLTVVGRPRVIEDREGETFTGSLLEEELRKHPPSRTLADSLLLRRENWWFLPRVIVAVEPDALLEVGPRAGGAGDGVLGTVAEDTTGSGMLRIATVGVSSAVSSAGSSAGLPGRRAGGDRVEVAPIAASHLPPPGSRRPCVLLGHDFSTPDLERWSAWTIRGSLNGSAVEIAGRTGRADLPRPSGLVARLRRQHDLGAACRRALA